MGPNGWLLKAHASTVCVLHRPLSYSAGQRACRPFPPLCLPVCLRHRRRYQLLLESLLPKEVIRDLHQLNNKAGEAGLAPHMPGMAAGAQQQRPGGGGRGGPGRGGGGAGSGSGSSGCLKCWRVLTVLSYCVRRTELADSVSVSMLINCYDRR